MTWGIGWCKLGRLTMHWQPHSIYVAIKLLHTAIWAFMASCIVAIPIAGGLRRFRWVGVLSTLVLLECLVLALNGGRCPLSDLAGRFTTLRADNFDIYLPMWLARYNKTIFGTLFVAGELMVFGRWMASRRRASGPPGC
jgi:hypothetical protein